VKQGELDEAIAQFRRALTLSPEFVAARKALASTLLRQGRVDDSVREYEELVRLVPDSPTARRGLERARAVAALRARARRRS
jgi:Flp pilus assembly protein TadD